MSIDFEYYRPSTISEALQLKSQFGLKAVFMAGGTDEMITLKEQHKCSFEHMISIRGIPGLNYIKEENGKLYIGAVATFSEITKSALINSKYAILKDAASQVGSVQVRNAATIGGNVCTSLPSADISSPLLALGAQVKIASAARGERIQDLADFFIAPGKNILREDELLVEFIIPAAEPHSAGAYYKVGRRKALDIATMAAAVYIKLDKDKKICDDARIALTTVAPTPLRVKAAVAELIGKPVTEETLTKAGLAAAKEASPRSSFRSDADYRKDVIPVAVKRAGLLALERALA